MEDAWVHGEKLDPFTGFYPQQIEALKRVAGSPLCNRHPYEAPVNQFARHQQSMSKMLRMVSFQDL